MFNIIGLEKGRFQPHARGQGCLELLQHFAHTGGYAGHIGAVFLRCGDKHGAVTIKAGQVLGLFLPPSNLGHIAHAHDLAINAGHRDRAYRF